MPQPMPRPTTDLDLIKQRCGKKVAKMFIQNLDDHVHTSEELLHAFVWGESPEKTEFWAEIHTTINLSGELS